MDRAGRNGHGHDDDHPDGGGDRHGDGDGDGGPPPVNGTALPTEGFLREECGLTRAQIPVVYQLIAGKTDKEIAAELGIAYGTVRRRTDATKKKLGVGDKLSVVATVYQKAILKMLEDKGGDGDSDETEDIPNAK